MLPWTRFRRPLLLCLRYIRGTFCSSFASRSIGGGLRHETCELTLHRLDRTVAPGISDGRRRRIGKDLVFATLQSVENAGCRGLRRCLRYLEASVHLRVDGAEHDRVDRNAFSGEERPQRLRHVEGGRLRYRIGGDYR